MCSPYQFRRSSVFTRSTKGRYVNFQGFQNKGRGQLSQNKRPLKDVIQPYEIPQSPRRAGSSSHRFVHIPRATARFCLLRQQRVGLHCNNNYLPQIDGNDKRQSGRSAIATSHYD